MIRRAALHADPQMCERSVPGLDGQLRVLSFIAAEAKKRAVDLVLSGGDTSERARVSPAEAEAIDAYVKEQAAVADFGAAYGNHDDRTLFGLLNNVRAPHRIVAATRPCVEMLGGFAVAFFPYPSMASLRAYLAETRPDWVPSIAEAGEIARAMMRNVFLGLGQQLDALATPATPRIMVLHGLTTGGFSSTGQEITGDELRIGLEDMGLARCAFYACGHLHDGPRNEFVVPNADGTQAPGCHVGSTRRHDFGELGDKRMIVLTFDDATLVGREDIPLPVPLMAHVASEWGGETGFTDLRGIPPAASALKDALVRLRYDVDPSDQEAASAAAERLADGWRAAGAALVKIEAVVRPVSAARAPEVARAVGVPAKLAALRAARGTALDPEREKRLAAKLAVVEGEVAL